MNKKQIQTLGLIFTNGTIACQPFVMWCDWDFDTAPIRPREDLLLH